MKKINDKKQDLLLDALSCIDEDILERGLALRDGAAAPKAAESAPKPPRPATVIPPLYDLTRQPDKPPKKNPWRVISVVAAACLLLSVVPLSMWMVGSMSKNENTPVGDILDGIGGIQGSLSNNESPDDDFYDPMNSAPEMETPSEEAPYYDPERLSWTIISNQNNYVNYYTKGKNAIELQMYGSVQTSNESLNDPVSPEDQAMLELFGQRILSMLSLDYAGHFPLFHEKIVEERFLSQIAAHGYTYDQAISQLRFRTYVLFPVQKITVNMVLTENSLLSEEELESYRQQLVDNVPDASRITAVRHITFTGTVALNVVMAFDLAESVFGTLTCYEYDGVWYLDHSLMDDDSIIDLLLSDPASNAGYFKTQTATFTVVGTQNNYLVTEEGTLFFFANAEVYTQNSKGKWERVSIFDIPIGATVTVTYYNFELEGFTFIGGDEHMQYSICTAKTIHIGG